LSLFSSFTYTPDVLPTAPDNDDQPQKSAPGSGGANAKGFRFALVASRWNDSIVSRLIAGALDGLAELGAEEKDIQVFRVPGSFEIPLCALKAAESEKFDAVICLGVIIRGETPHFEFIASETARGIGEAGLKTGVPLLFGVITAENVDQAIERAGVKLGNKGFEAATAAVELVNLYKEDFEKR
jgi:6,7-dimethyl-8-ribityllumazine synthase